MHTHVVLTPIENNIGTLPDIAKSDQSSMESDSECKATVKFFINGPSLSEPVQSGDTCGYDLSGENELSLGSSMSSIDHSEPVSACAKHTVDHKEPETIEQSKMAVPDINEKPLPDPKKYIDIESVAQNKHVDISSLYYCKRCFVDLKQAKQWDCPNNFNLCNDCCHKSTEYCNVCSHWPYHAVYVD